MNKVYRVSYYKGEKRMKTWNLVSAPDAMEATLIAEEKKAPRTATRMEVAEVTFTTAVVTHWDAAEEGSSIAQSE